MFARRRSPAVELNADPLTGELPPPPQTGITGPAAKLMQMLGLSPEMLNQTASEVAAMLKDFRDRLDRIEANQKQLFDIVEKGWQGYAERHPERQAFLEERARERERRNGTG